MNKIVATISQINTIDNLNIVEFEFNTHTLKMMSLDLDETIQVGHKVVLTVKPTHIAVGKNLQGELSYSNQMEAVIEHIEEGELLSVVHAKLFGVELQSIITSKSVQRMQLQKADAITLLIKASDLSILETIRD